MTEIEAGGRRRADNRRQRAGARRWRELPPEFHDHGIALFQMSQPVPDTLWLARLPEDAIDRVLTQNGLHLGFHLRHAYETAQFRAPERETLERLLRIPQIAALALTDVQ